MSVPVAGRRKGQSAAASPASASPAPPSQGGGPSWLDDLDSNSAPPAAAAAAQTTATAAHAVRAPASDPLGFLDEDEQPAGAEAGGWRDPPAAPRPTATAARAESMPLFLQDDEGDRGASTLGVSAALGATLAPFTTTTTSASAVPSLRAATAEDRRHEKHAADVALAQQQLAEVGRQLTEVAQRVAALQGDSNPLALEVASLARTVEELRAKEADARQRKAEQEAQRRHAAEQEAHAASTVSLDDYRKECALQCERQVEEVVQAATAQQECNSGLRAEWEAATAEDAEGAREAAVVEALLRGVQDGARHLKRRLALQCSLTVSETARAHLAAARQQRSAVFARDAAAREATLEENRAKRETDIAAFHDSCRRVFQERTDTAFGAVKASVDAAHQLHLAERRQRIAAFQCHIAAITERSREALAQQVRRRAEQEYAIIATQRTAAATELAARQEELAAQHRTFRLRAEAELSALRDSRGAASTTAAAAAKPTPPATHGDVASSAAAAQETCLTELDRTRARLGQLVTSLRLKQRRQHAGGYASAVAGGQRASGAVGGAGEHMPSASPRGCSATVAQLSEGWQRSLAEVQHSRDVLRRTIDEVRDVARGSAEKLHRRRTLVTQRRDDVRAVRAEWEQAVRRQLSQCLTTTSNTAVSPPASLATNTLHNLTRRVGDVVRAQQSLRATRGDLTAELGVWSESVIRYRVETERLLADIFRNFDLLRDGSVLAVESQLSLQSMQEEVDALGRDVAEKAHRLAMHKRHIESAVKNLHASSVLSLTASAPLSATSLKLPLTRHNRAAAASSHHTGVTRAAATHYRAADVWREPPSLSSTAKKAPVAATCPSRSSVGTARSVAAYRGDVGGSRRGGTGCSSRDATERRPIASAETPPAPAPAVSLVDLTGSRSPSPIVPSLDRNRTWIADDGGNAPAHCADRRDLAVAAATASPAEEDVQDEFEEEEEEDVAADSFTDLLPLAEDEDSYLDAASTRTR
ncbi:l6202.3-like protein [Novymonas esmeraldas]|uniref:L6202.3-like protein n=1 Tax=Novymonas esmeraldas TaxID=1808958 RepID=A0AAW0F798_9TRYP